MKIFLDLEYTNWAFDRDTISIGLVADNGRTFYAELNGFFCLRPSEDAKIIIKNLYQPASPGSTIAAFDEDGKSILVEENGVFSANIREAHSFRLFRTQKKALGHYLEQWLNSFEEPVEMWTYIVPYQWELFNQVFEKDSAKLPENINKIPLDIATVVKTKGIDPEEFDIEEFVLQSNKKTKSKKKAKQEERITALTMATLYKEALNLLEV